MWAIAAAALAWIFSKTPPREVLDALARTSPLLFATWTVTFCLLTLFLDTVTHYWLFNRFNPRMDFITVLRTRGETYLLLSFGFLYGQGGMAWFISRRTGKPLAEVGGSILFLMFNSLLILLAFPTLALLLFVPQMADSAFRQSEEWKVVATWLMVSWPLIALHFIFWGKFWDNPLRRRLTGGLALAFGRADWKDYAAALLLRGVQSVNWCVFSWLALLSCSIHLPFKNLLLFGPMIGLISAIPTPGRLGTTQAGWGLLFQNQADLAGLVAFSLLWTVSVNILRWLFGAVFLLFSKREGTGTGQAPAPVK